MSLIQAEQLWKKYPDTILLFREGSEFVAYGKDAKKLKEMKGVDRIPNHLLDTVVAPLVKSGQRVAICEQMEKPTQEVPQLTLF